VDFDAERGDVLLLEFTGEMALDEGGLPQTNKSAIKFYNIRSGIESRQNRSPFQYHHRRQGRA
jgi:hypothetical protein